MKHGATKEAKSQTLNTSILVIGYGNPYRRDDGAGPVFAEKLTRCWLKQGIATRVITDIQLMPEMVEEIARDEINAVVFVDSGVNIPSFTFQTSQVEIDAVSPTLGHQLEPATLLVYASLLYGHCPRAWLVTVPGVDFAHGHGFSPQVAHLLHGVTALAQQLLSEMKEYAMHELAIAQSLIDTAIALMPAGTSQVARLHVQLGTLAGLSKDELTFGFEVMSKQTPCAEAKLEIEEIPAVVYCPQCGNEYSIDDDRFLICPTCGTPAVLILQGKELQITSIEIMDEVVHG
jgi:hydrogenase nickel incorporation protein HypA/HybF